MSYPPSKVRLPQQKPEGLETLLDFMIWRFPRISPEIWRWRFAEGKVFWKEGLLSADEPYQPLLDVHYYREVDEEYPVRRDYRVIDKDVDLLVVDKPPFLPVTPGGRYVRHCLLNMLIEESGNEQLAPLHRLDKDTSGLVIFSRRRESRSDWATFFRLPNTRLQKTYLAIVESDDPNVGVGERFPAHIQLQHRIERSPTEYHRQCVVRGKPPNAFLEGECLEYSQGKALYRLHPRSGRKHQIRVQLSHEGLPIAGDSLYGPNAKYDPCDIQHPLRLHCESIEISPPSEPKLTGGISRRSWTCEPREYFHL